MELIEGGSDGGAAILRATGVDDRLELIEYQLVREVAASGSPKPPSEPIGIRVEVDYVLEPGDPVLSITTRVVAEQDGVFSGELVVLQSEDGRDPALRLRLVAPGRAAAVGLEVVVNTNHEMIEDLSAERGATVRGLNHPGEYLEVIEFDPVAAIAGLQDPAVIGVDPDAELWSWDFEQIELQDGAPGAAIR